VLIAFDLLLVVVLGLLLYSVSARDPRSPPGIFDVLQVVLLVSAPLADAVALWAIAARISEFGFSPNRVAALGENVILLVNLAWSAALYVSFLRGRGSFSLLKRWQTDYLPVYAVWVAIVVIAFRRCSGTSDRVLAVGIIGAIIARFQPHGMARALFATALARGHRQT
jgi:hypothetical protein